MINTQQIQAIVDYVEQHGLCEAVVGELRNSFPGCHLTYCMDDDITYPRPYLERPGFNIYLVDSREHCSVLTDDKSIASGMVLAEIIE